MIGFGSRLYISDNQLRRAMVKAERREQMKNKRFYAEQMEAEWLLVLKRKYGGKAAKKASRWRYV